MNKIIAVIPARKGSKGLPSKNILPLKGIPLVKHSILLAKAINLFSKIIVSTDCEIVAEVAESIPEVLVVSRPASLAQDHSSVIDVLLHAVESTHDQGSCGEISIALLQPTSPFRSVKDIKNAINQYHSDTTCPLVSVTESQQHYLETVLCTSDGKWVNPPGISYSEGRQNYQFKSYFISGSLYIAQYSFPQETQYIFFS